MFFERYWGLLKERGRLITVVDDTLLASEMFDWFRDFIRRRFVIRAMISLPGDAFRRSGSRVKTSVLVLEKKKSESESQPACYGYFSQSLGIDDLTPRASDADIAEARAAADAEIDTISREYKDFLRGKESGLLLPADRLTGRLDLKFCAPDFGRMAVKWKQQGVEVRRLDGIVKPVENAFFPETSPDSEFKLIKVTYEGECVLEKVRKGSRIKASKMFRVKKGELVFSTIRATDGAIGIVPEEFDGALVSGSYTVFEVGTPEDTAYLWATLRSSELRADMQSQSPGSGRYTTYWPEIGSLLIPWLDEKKRRKVGEALIRSWNLERTMLEERRKALLEIEALGVESEESKRRFLASKAPT
jgi:type I restriction enzyme M protein